LQCKTLARRQLHPQPKLCEGLASYHINKKFSPVAQSYAPMEPCSKQSLVFIVSQSNPLP
jgi:hypothetical protein